MPDRFNRLESTWCIQESGIQYNEHFCILLVGGPAVVHAAALLLGHKMEQSCC